MRANTHKLFSLDKAKPPSDTCNYDPKQPPLRVLEPRAHKYVQIYGFSSRSPKPGPGHTRTF